MSGFSDEHGAYSNGLHRQDGLGQRSNFPIYDAFGPFSPAQRPMEIDATKTQQIPQPETARIPSLDELATEARKVHASFVMIKKKWFTIEEARNDNFTNLNVDFGYFTNRLCNDLGTFPDQPPETFSDSQQRICSEVLAPKSRILTHNISLHSRSWRRLSDRLLPLLRREQDFKALQQWAEITRLSSSFIHLLDENESILEDADNILMALLFQIEAILNCFKLRFRRRCDELRQKYGLTQAVSEFPNNLRHICTTMPWTIAPALLVLWGVCWMFYASVSPEYSRNAAAEPVPSPSPAIPSFLDDPSNIDTFDYLQYLNIPYLDGEGSQDIVQDAVHHDLDVESGLVDPLSIIQDTPRDPEFLTVGTFLQTSNFDLEMLGQHIDDTNWLPEATTSDIQPQQAPDHQSATNVSGPESESQCASEQNEPRFVCQDCQQPFARPYTLKRHRVQAHAESASTVKRLFPCPSPHCKRSKERSPFKRPDGLKRHLKNCKYGKDIVRLQAGPTSPLIVPTLTPPSPDKIPEPEVNPGAEVRSNETKKRTRSEDKEDTLGDTRLMDDVVRRYKRMAQEVKEKEVDYLRKKQEYLQSLEDLKLLEKIIRTSKSPRLDS